MSTRAPRRADGCGRLRRLTSLVVPVLAWVLAGVMVLVLAAAVIAPRLAGATPYTVLTGSMTPSYPPGTLVVVRPTPTDELRTGDVVTYQLHSGEPEVVTHRIVGVGVRADGTPVFTTRGDANDVADPAPVLATQVRGRLWYAVPYVGRLQVLFTADQRRTASMLVALALVGYALAMFAGAARDRRRPSALADATASGAEEPADRNLRPLAP